MYTNDCYEVNMLRSSGEPLQTMASTGDVAIWGPGFRPHVVRAVALVLNADPNSAGVLKFDLRPTRGSDTNRTDGTVGTLSWATTDTFTAGSEVRIIYEELGNSAVTVYPGQEVVAEVTDADTSNDGVRIVLFVEALPMRPAMIDELSTSSTMVAG